MDAEVEKFVRNCRGCTLVAAPDPPEPMCRSQLPTTPWQSLALDFLGPLPDGQHLLVVIDCFSRFMEICEMNTITSKDVIRELRIMFSRYGVPSVIKADNAPQLSAECVDFNKFCSDHGIKIVNTIPYWPQANGEVERQNRSILKRLKISQELGKDWRAELRTYLLTYHATRHPTTGKSPGELMFARRIKTKLPSLTDFREDEEVMDRDALVKAKGKEYSDSKRRAKESTIFVGDHVLIKRMKKNNKLETEYANEEYVVCEKKGTDTTVKSLHTGKEYRRSSAHLKKIFRDNQDSDNSSRQEETNELVSAEKDAENNNYVLEPLSQDNHNKTTSTTEPKRIRQQPAKFNDYIPH
ncbi:uncharacterized protein K02A2.6-like [Uranotaenia lowii]|uniref:uncharacterized protein K02A2.6-like n=1 Tax=Uranotaenia lowii TaxID=190385 RepID=UPI00247A2302|nr:uncharacterized protein K02A2.6-like [Uranotaenia lowii]